MHKGDVSLKRRGVSIILGAVLIFGIICMLGVGLVVRFQARRQAEWTGIDVERLVADCQVLYREERPAVRVDDPLELSMGSLPGEVKYIPTLKPKCVYVGQRGVVVQKIGGGVYQHGGWLVLFDAGGKSAEEIAKEFEGELRILDRRRMVFIYGVYDYSRLPYN